MTVRMMPYLQYLGSRQQSFGKDLLLSLYSTALQLVDLNPIEHLKNVEQQICSVCVQPTETVRCCHVNMDQNL